MEPTADPLDIDRDERASVLVVDDECDAADLLKEILESAGYRASTAANGIDAVALYQEERPDAVLLDINMPVMDGLTALHEIRRIDPDARIAMLTASAQHMAVREAVEGGALDFILKPVDIVRVLGALESLLAA